MDELEINIETIIARVQKWLQKPYDKKTQKQVQFLLKEDPKSLIDSFYTTMTFGTGGLRGLMGVGTNRLNCYTIRKATQGLSSYIKKYAPPPHSVFISYDSRENSRLFAEETARTLAANEIEVYITKELRPTPFVSFGCRLHRCTAAVMITASHNPPNYNGYKVYWSDGGQIVSPHDLGIIDEIKNIEDLPQIKFAPLSHPSIHHIGKEDDEAYFNAIEPLQNYPEVNQSEGAILQIVYSSLHGTGATLLPDALKRWGFTSIDYVTEQMPPDGTFPFAASLNPEKKEALELGIKELVRRKGDFFIATDPDADRIALVVSHLNNPIVLSGNQIASLCIYYLCKTLSTIGKMPHNGAFITTIVTTELCKEIAASFNKHCIEVLTGFKYIGEKIKEWEESLNGKKFIFGAEESFGYLLGTHSRDKDAIVTACLLAEMALQQKKAGKTLIDLLYEIYNKYGVHQEKQQLIHFDGDHKGKAKINFLMKNIRENPPKTLCGSDIVELEDFQLGKKVNCITNEMELIDLPKSNVLLFRCKNGSKCIIRPSGTEPLIKIYAMMKELHATSIEEGLKSCHEHLDLMLKTLIETYFSE